MNYGKRLKQARKAKGLTQGELSEISGVKQGTISKIERGDQDSSGFDAVLANALDVDAFWLSTGGGSMRDLPASRGDEKILLAMYRVMSKGQQQALTDIAQTILRNT